MKQILFALLALTLAACAPATVPPTPTATANTVATIVASTMQAVTPLAPPPTPTHDLVPTSVSVNGLVVSYQNISFAIPTGMASGATGQVVPRAEGADVAPWEMAPEHTVVTLNDYVMGKRLLEPQIFVYPADEFAQMDEGAAAIIQQLRTILGDNSPGLPDKLPHLPVFNAAQVFVAQAKKIDFGSGKGLRYISQYDQAYIAINNNELFYTFQGLTGDGKYYVAVDLPITTPLLDTMSAPNPSDPGFTADQWVAYVDGISKTLNSLDPAFFSPPLDTFDALVQSITIAP